MTRTYFHEFYREVGDDEVKVTVEYTATYSQPAEASEIEIVKALLEDGTDAAMTDDEDERWSQWLAENPRQCAHGDDDYPEDC